MGLPAKEFISESPLCDSQVFQTLESLQLPPSQAGGEDECGETTLSHRPEHLCLFYKSPEPSPPAAQLTPTATSST